METATSSHSCRTLPCCEIERHGAEAMEQTFEKRAARNQRGERRRGDRNDAQLAGTSAQPVVQRDLIGEREGGDVVQKKSALLFLRQVERPRKRTEPDRRRSQVHHFCGNRGELASPAP